MYHFRYRVFCNVMAYVSCREYDSTLQEHYYIFMVMNQGGTADNSIYSSLTEIESVKDVFVCRRIKLL